MFLGISYFIFWCAIFPVAVGALAVFVQYAIRSFRAQRLQRKFEAEGRVVSWDTIKHTPDKGIVWLNKSDLHFRGLRLWWIPGDMEPELDFFARWYDCGLLIDQQKLSKAEITAAGHTINEYHQWEVCLAPASKPNRTNHAP